MAEDEIHPKTGNAYVYAIFVDGVVRYIGKGTGPRAKVHLRHANRLNALRASGRVIKASKFYNQLCAAILRGVSVDIQYLATGLSDEEAFAVETVEIAGRDAASLWNLKGGGDGFRSEDAYSIWADPNLRSRSEHSATMRAALDDPAVRKRISDGTKKGLTADVLVRRQANQKLAANRDEVKAAKAEAARQRWEAPEFRAAFRAKMASPEVRAKMSRAAKTRGARSDFVESMKAGMAEKYGAARRSSVMVKALSCVSVRAKLSAASKSRWADPEWRAKVLLARANAKRLRKDDR